MSFIRLPTIGKCKEKKKLLYDVNLLKTAYDEVASGKISVHRAARKYGIPDSTLRDRFRGVQPAPDDNSSIKLGRTPLFSSSEELHLVSHCTYMASIGYGYSRNAFLNLATDYAVSLRKKSSSDPRFKQSWYDGFKTRHPNITLSKPQKLSMVRAKCTSDEVLDKYFDSLKKVVETNDLMDKPENIWNIDETGLMMEHSPSNVICAKGSAPQAITSNRGKTVTIIAAGSAVGMRIPPFYVFPGKRWNAELLDGACPGTSGTMSETGWSNTEVFMDYLSQHFLKHVPKNGSPILVLFDGHKSHVNLTLSEWGKRHNLIFFVIPPHTSHVTQPLDVACFGPLKRVYYNECQLFLRQNPGMQVNRLNVAAISSKAYNKGLTPENLISAFSKSGIYPVERKKITPLKTAPSKIYRDEQNEKHDEASVDFLDSRKILKVTTPGKRKQTVQSVQGNLMSPTNTPLLKLPIHKSPPQKKQKCIRSNKKNPVSPKPSTSGFQSTKGSALPADSDTCSSDSEIDESQLCCMCKKLTPDTFNTTFTVEFIQWAQCDKCEGWVHLKYCTPIKVIRRGCSFLCPRCDIEC